MLETGATSLSEQYTILDRIGEGGNASVHRAIDLQRGRTVALKRYDQRLERDMTFVATFRRDAQNAQGLDHPHVLPILSYGFADDQYYVTRDYIGGGNLDGHLRQVGSTGVVPEIGTIIRQICDGLHYIHQSGYLHSNIKPANVLFRLEHSIVLTDMGPSHHMGSTGLTITDASLGAVGYFSPEQVIGADLLPASDVYAVGVLLYQACTGLLPFRGANPLAVAYQVVHDTPAPPRALNPRVSAALEAVILRCLSKGVQERYSTARELEEALREPLLWRPDPETHLQMQSVAIGGRLWRSIPTLARRLPRRARRKQG